MKEQIEINFYLCEVKFSVKDFHDKVRLRMTGFFFFFFFFSEGLFPG